MGSNGILAIERALKDNFTGVFQLPLKFNYRQSSDQFRWSGSNAASTSGKNFTVSLSLNVGMRSFEEGAYVSCA